MPGNSAPQLATIVQDVTCKLGRISDLVNELADLRLAVPALKSVETQGTVIKLVFLGLEAELKFEVQLNIGKQYMSHVVTAVALCLSR